MMQALERIPNFTQISDDLAVGGQISERDIAKLKNEGYGFILHVEVQGIALLIKNEAEQVIRAGMLYEKITINYHAPCEADFIAVAELLDKFKKLKIYVHCTIGFCSSALMLPYLMKHFAWTLEEAQKAAVDWIIPPHWEAVIQKRIVAISEQK